MKEKKKTANKIDVKGKKKKKVPRKIGEKNVCMAEVGGKRYEFKGEKMQYL